MHVRERERERAVLAWPFVCNSPSQGKVLIYVDISDEEIYLCSSDDIRYVRATGSS